jgi:hypothetical protein
MSSLNSAFSKAAAAAFEIGEASAITIGFRLPLIVSAPFWPQYDTLFELQRMVVEKMAAGMEASVAAMQAGSSVAAKAALGRAGPGDVATTMLTIATAAALPIRRRARANARRLSGQR